MLIEIVKKDQTYQFEAEPDEKLLFAGLRAGIPLPYECSTGTCGSCRARLKEGDLDEGWLDAPGKANLKADKHEFLMCQATAKSDCKLGVPSKINAFRPDDITPAHYQGKLGNLSYLTKDVIQFNVKMERPVSFHPGQFFVLKAPGVSGYRAYSMVNYEKETNSLEFIIKQNPSGLFSNWIFDESRQVDDIELFGPLGQATFHTDEDHDLLLIAGGSGIAGLMSILERACQEDYFAHHKVRLFFGVRTREDLFFAERLKNFKVLFPGNIDIHLVFSSESDSPIPENESDSFTYSYGWVHEAALKTAFKSETQDQNNTMVYLAGPQPLVDACIRPLIIEAKVAANMIRYDKFS